MELSPKRDTDLRFTEGGKKRSLSNEPGDNEPTNKKNRADTDLYENFLLKLKVETWTLIDELNFFCYFRLFGNKDVDLRTLGEAAQSGERKSKSVSSANSNVFHFHACHHSPTFN